VNKLIAAAALALLALFMLAGFATSGRSLAAPATLAALAITVVLPGAGAALLARSHLSEKSRLSGRKAELRERTVQAEVLRLARERGGKLTAVEVTTALALPPAEARAALEEMALSGQAELEITDAGVLVYSFYEVRHLGGKDSARGVLDA
jgi:hypothetical protein